MFLTVWWHLVETIGSPSLSVAIWTMVVTFLNWLCIWPRPKWFVTLNCRYINVSVVLTLCKVSGLMLWSPFNVIQALKDLMGFSSNHCPTMSRLKWLSNSQINLWFPFLYFWSQSMTPSYVFFFSHIESLVSYDCIISKTTQSYFTVLTYYFTLLLVIL